MHKSAIVRADPDAHAIRAPGPRLLRDVPLSFVDRSRNARGRRGHSPTLNLVSFIDFLVVTVIFLLMSFSASGEVPPRGIELPPASSGVDLVDAPVVAVGGHQILLDGALAGSTRAVDELGRLEKIQPLFDMLVAKRRLWTAVEPNRAFPGVCILQIDREVPAIVVKSVFHTAVLADYKEVSFMVKQISGQP